jgi:3-phenylpropionate/trans-cinnamate dioxygenase ferredoxin subunit
VSESIEVALIPELKEGTMKKVIIMGNSILLALVKGRYFAVDAVCPHLEADLSFGTLKETTLTCPMHSSQFDLRDGHVIRWTDQTGIRLDFASRAHPPKPLKHYPVRTEGNKIFISLEKPPIS